MRQLQVAWNTCNLILQRTEEFFQKQTKKIFEEIMAKIYPFFNEIFKSTYLRSSRDPSTRNMNKKKEIVKSNGILTVGKAVLGANG